MQRDSNIRARQNIAWLRLAVLGLAGVLAACSGSSGSGSGDDSVNTDPDPVEAQPTRSFYMGFTPWPYDATQAAVDDSYNRIQRHGDIVAQHLSQGIPWQAALDGSVLPAAVEAEIDSRIAHMQTDKDIYLAIDSLNGSRDGLALNWQTDENQPLPAPWDSRNFADAEVITAYSQYALHMISRFDPDYVNYGTEVSELILNDPAAFSQYLTFAESVYDNIKTVHPDLPLMVSIALKSPGSTEMQTIASNIEALMPYVDIVGISVYPYAFFEHNDKGDPANLTGDWLDQIAGIAGDKPVAVTETGWIGEDLEIAGFGYSEQSDPPKQADYVKMLLEEAGELSAEFVIWFTVVDFDALWNGVLGRDHLSKIWKDTGLYDETLQPRSALTVWEAYFERERLP